MTGIRTTAAILLAVAVAVSATATAAAPTPTDHKYPLLRASVKKFGKQQVNHYRRLHGWARAQLGKRVPGRNIVFYGMPAKGWPDRLATKAELAETTARLERWKNPPAPVPAVTSYQQAGASGGGGCTGMSAESGSAGYNAYNPNGGYIGCYQIAPGHYSSGGSCAGLGTDPAGQDACARIICATEGPGAWTNPAGQNPCGRP